MDASLDNAILIAPLHNCWCHSRDVVMFSYSISTLTVPFFGGQWLNSRFVFICFGFSAASSLAAISRASALNHSSLLTIKFMPLQLQLPLWIAYLLLAY